MSTIANAANQPLFAKAGTIPDLSGGMQDYYQSMVFEPVKKESLAFQVIEVGNPINFRGVIMPFSGRQLALKPEGQRAWSWFSLFSDPVLTLNVDDVVLWKGKQTRVMGRKDFALYGYCAYELVQDWTGSGPQ